MTIAGALKLNHRLKRLTDTQYILKCKEFAVNEYMDGPNYVVFTFDDSSSVSVYYHPSIYKEITF